MSRLYSYPFGGQWLSGRAQAGRLNSAGQFFSAGSDYVWPQTSVGHNFFVRTPFRVFLDSMERSLS